MRKNVWKQSYISRLWVIYFRKWQHWISKLQKHGENTITQNYRHSVMSKRYLVSNLFGQFHRILDSSSTKQNFLEGLEKSKVIFLRNQYPIFLINIFLINKKNGPVSETKRKPRKSPLWCNFSLKLFLAQNRILCKTINLKNKKCTPWATYKFGFENGEIESTFSRASKAAPPDKFDTPEVVYEFICPCKENYIGQINRPLNKRPLPAW